MRWGEHIYGNQYDYILRQKKRVGDAKQRYTSSKGSKNKEYIRQKREAYKYAKRKLRASRIIGRSGYTPLRRGARKHYTANTVLGSGVSFAKVLAGGIMVGAPLAGLGYGVLGGALYGAVRNGSAYVAHKLSYKLRDATTKRLSKKYNIPRLNPNIQTNH